MKNFTSLTAFAEHLNTIATGDAPALHAGLVQVANRVRDAAKAKIGEYQEESGPFPAWEPLAASTLEEKERLGFSPPDNPLLRTGEMRDSISATVVGRDAIVGSTSDKALWHELGTKHIPPRPFLGPAAHEQQHFIERLIGRAFYKVLGGK